MTYEDGVRHERERIVKILTNYFPALEQPEKNALSLLGKRTLVNLLKQINAHGYNGGQAF